MIERTQNAAPELRRRVQLIFALLTAGVMAASMWFYVIDVLRARQIDESQAKGIPRGNLSDLYPRWLGTRELLLHHRNPYSREVTLEIQDGYYGRRLDLNRPNDPKDQQGFAYPLYVVFLLAPLIGLSFQTVQIVFYWLLVGLTAASIFLWLRVLRWRLPWRAAVTAIVLTLGSFPAVQGIKLQQLSLLAAVLLAGAAACVASGFLFCGGALLALATIKPQLALLLAAWLIVWTVADWRTRRRFLFGFALVMALLLGGAEVAMRGWLQQFLGALHEYHRYTQNQSVLDQLLPGVLARIAVLLAAVLSAFLLWKMRKAPAQDVQFGRAIALLMSLTILVVPMYAPYNQVLLLPAIFLLLRDRKMFLSGSRGLRFVFVAGALGVSWQWIASLSLSGLYFLSPQRALEGWTWPFFATFALPVLVFALTVMDVQNSLRSLGHPRTETGADKNEPSGT